MSTHQTWRKSSRSNPDSLCVELTVGHTEARIRDTKNRNGGALTIGAASFQAFLASVKTGKLDQ